MFDRTRISLNRSACPGLNLEEFFALTAELNLGKVELRNDLPGVEMIDHFPPEQVRELAGQYGIQVIALSAIQNFNVTSLVPLVLEQIQELIQLSTAIGCKGIVLFPRYSVKDTRNPEQCFQDTVKALKEFAPLFAAHNFIGYIKPLGFEISTLPSVITTMKAIQDSGGQHYKIVYDTFHHYIGPDTLETFIKEYDVSYTGLIHVSGIDHEISKSQYRDPQRGLVSPADTLKSREQIEQLLSSGYAGDISLEPLAETLQQLDRDDLKTAIQASIAYLLGE